ncbi:T9SS type A sorting domain-containing protein, partial [Gramella jeungdoensis]
NAVYTPGSNDLSSGTVTLTLTTDDPDGPCDEASDTVVINFYDDPDAGENGNDQFCYGDESKSSINLIDLLNGSPDSGGDWEETSSILSGLTIGDGTNLDFSEVAPGTYTFVYTVEPDDQNSTCEPDNAEVTIVIDPLPVAPQIQTQLADCIGGDGSAAFSYADPEITQFYYRYKDANDPEAVFTSWTLYTGVVLLQPGSYTFEVKYTEDGCLSDEFTVNINKPQDTVVTLTPDVTQPDCATFLGTIEISNAAALGDLNYTVYTQGVALASYDDVKYPSGGFTGLEAGAYFITADSDNGCEFGSVEVTLLEPQCIECETAFAYDSETGICFDNYPDLIPNDSRWGWTNYYSEAGDYTLDLYAGAGQCDITKGTLVGAVNIIDNEDGTIDVQFIADPGYAMSSVHLYVGCEPLPYKKKGNNYEYTVAPGQYPQNPNGNIGYVTDYTIENIDVNGDFYVIGHVDICTSENTELITEVRSEAVPVNYTLNRRFSVMQSCIDFNGALSKTAETSSLTSSSLTESSEPLFTVAPNPFTSELNIGYLFDYTSDVSIQIFDLNGRLLATYTDTAVNSDSISSFSVDFKTRSGQIYIVRMTTDREIFTSKIVSGN